MSQKAFALYRLPYSTACWLSVQESEGPITFNHIRELEGKEGFAICPFTPSANEPIILIQGNTIPYVHKETVLPACYEGKKLPIADERWERYQDIFSHFHQALKENSFEKLVLARRLTLSKESDESAENLFVEACQKYPRMMIALVSAPQCGTWLMATPETLLQGSGNKWHTMALAGTLPLTPAQKEFFNSASGICDTNLLPWDEKNKAEQKLVASFIQNTLQQYATNIAQEPTHCVRAGDVAHLRNLFHFTISSENSIASLLEALHPTPAICGIPQKRAHDFILRYEESPRQYYSGFIGPWGKETHLFVSLRCMRILPKQYVLHAGGGILAQSVCRTEWEETTQKFKTIQSCTAICNK